MQVQAKALRGVGGAIPALTPGLESSKDSMAAVDRFLESVDSASVATQPTEVRAAAVQALQASALLQAASSNGGESCFCHVRKRRVSQNRYSP